MFNFRIPGLIGEGLRLVWDAGGAKGNIDLETTTKNSRSR